MSKTRIFVSFDIEHDRGLYDRLLDDSKRFGFVVAARSERANAASPGNEGVRQRIRDADQVIIICSEHTDGCASVHAELRIAQQERTPYFLLWGRSDVMCTKPLGAKRDEGMYRWTRQIVQEQIAFTSRKITEDQTAEIAGKALRKS